MTVTTLAFFGDSLETGTVNNVDNFAGGIGSHFEQTMERLANLLGIPRLSSGVRCAMLGVAEASFTTGGNAWTDVTASDAWDKMPYGLGRYGTGINKVLTYKPTDTGSQGVRPTVGFALYWVDLSNGTTIVGGNWQYRIDGGTWTNMGQTLAHDNAIKKFYVASAVTSTVEVRCYDGSADCYAMVPAIEWFWTNPVGANGLIGHNYAIAARDLHSTAPASSPGDHLAVLDSISLGSGSPPSSTPDITIVFHGHDAIDFPAGSTDYATDVQTVYDRAKAVGKFGVINPYEFNVGLAAATVQTAFRDAVTQKVGVLAAANTSNPPQLLDLFLAYFNLGFGGANAQSANLVTAGYLSDGTHQTQQGNNDLADRIYWWIRSQFFYIGAAGRQFKVGSSQLGSTDVLGGISQAILPAGVAVTVTKGSATLKATNTLAATGKQVTVTAGTATLHATATIAATGRAVSVTAGTPTLVPGGVTRTATGKAITVTAGAATLHASNTLAPAGKAVTVTAGSATLAAGAVTRTATGVALAVTAGTASLHAASTLTPSGVPITITAGAPSVLAGAVARTASGVPVAVTAGTATIRASNTLAASGVALTVSAGAPTLLAGVAALTPSGHTLTVTAGSAVLHAATTIAVSGVPITVTAGASLIKPTSTVAASGVPIAVTAGTPTIIPGPAAIAVSGHAISVTAGAPTILAGAVTIQATGVPIATSPIITDDQGYPITDENGAPFLSEIAAVVVIGALTLHPAGHAVTVTAGAAVAVVGIVAVGVPVTVVAGTATILGGASEPRHATVTVAGDWHATVTVSGEPRATVTVGAERRASVAVGADVRASVSVEADLAATVSVG